MFVMTFILTSTFVVNQQCHLKNCADERSLSCILKVREGVFLRSYKMPPCRVRFCFKGATQCKLGSVLGFASLNLE